MIFGRAILGRHAKDDERRTATQPRAFRCVIMLGSFEWRVLEMRLAPRSAVVFGFRGPGAFPQLRHMPKPGHSKKPAPRFEYLYDWQHGGIWASTHPRSTRGRPSLQLSPSKTEEMAHTYNSKHPTLSSAW